MSNTDPVPAPAIPAAPWWTSRVFLHQLGIAVCMFLAALGHFLPKVEWIAKAAADQAGVFMLLEGGAAVGAVIFAGFAMRARAKAPDAPLTLTQKGADRLNSSYVKPPPAAGSSADPPSPPQQGIKT